MELLERYLQAVRFWLPRPQQDDIANELSEDIRSQIAEEEALLGRPINDGELEAILKKRGRPVVVANRYLPQRSLIGPVLFPVYWLVMKIAVGSYWATWFLVWMCFLLYGIGHHAPNVISRAVAEFWGNIWTGTFIAAGLITLIFALLERMQGNDRFADDWNPRSLPALRRRRNEISRVNSAFELAALVFFFIWWVTVMWPQEIFDHAGVRVVLAAQWRIFVVGVLALILATLVRSAVNLVRPYWTSTRAYITFAIDCTRAALFCWFLKVHMLAAITAPDLSAERGAHIVNIANAIMEKAFPFAVFGSVLAIGLSDVGRLIRLKRNGRQMRMQNASCSH